MKTFIVSLLLGLSVGAQQAPIDYRFDDVRRTVMLTHAGKQAHAAKGQQAMSGDTVSTGWFSSAIVASERHRARFELFGATTVTLASDTPGVILSLERGRIRTAFDKITGSEPRTVQTPGALLAVRGTKFDVEVDRGGNTTLDVFEGVVEVRSPLRAESSMVRAGEQSLFGPRRPPEMRPMPEDRRQNGPDADRTKNDRGRTDGRDPNHPSDPRGNDPRNGDRPPGGDPGHDSGHGQPNPPSPPPPPRKPPASF
jgi:hypothetical protein